MLSWTGWSCQPVSLNWLPCLGIGILSCCPQGSSSSSSLPTPPPPPSALCFLSASSSPASLLLAHQPPPLCQPPPLSQPPPPSASSSLPAFCISISFLFLHSLLFFWHLLPSLSTLSFSVSLLPTGLLLFCEPPPPLPASSSLIQDYLTHYSRPS